MSPQQYFRIATEILSRAPCKLLVVGAGRDTELYVTANRGGRTVVLEHDPRWLQTIERLGCTPLLVSYRTKLADGPLDPCTLPDGIPDWVLNETWDVILVDAPGGNRPEQPGRQQSIFLAATLAQTGTTVFLHDAERPAEQHFARQYFKSPDERYGTRQALAVFRYAEGEPVRDNQSQTSPGQAARSQLREPVDIVYLFRHSANNDQEILYSLRSVAQHVPFVRKVWVLGDRPAFLSPDKSLIEHVPHGYLAPLFGFQTPVRSDFLMLFLASLIPQLAFDFVRFSDDYIILQPVSPEQFLTVRALEDLNRAGARGQGRFKESVWRTYDILRHYGFAGINFESHTPQPYNKRLALEAFLAFREFLSEDRFEGILTPTTLYNYALKHHGLRFVWLADDKSRVGFYGGSPTIEQIAADCQNKSFLNFDDRAFGPAMVEYLDRLFPGPSKYEAAQS
jgi:glucuronoxylan 4-O-methyltransferase